MGVLSISNKLRYGLNPCYYYGISLSQAINYAISLTQYSLFPQNCIPITSKSSFVSTFWNGSNSTNQSSSSHNLRSQLFSTSCINSSSIKLTTLVTNRVSTADINTIVDVIKGDGIDMESRLNPIIPSIHLKGILEIFHCLNISKVPALRFFRWLHDTRPSCSRNSHICSLVFSNCGLLRDYANMLTLLIDYRNQQICLTEFAFGFLPISNVSMEIAKESITEVVGILIDVGGSCCNSGIHSLLEMLCSLSSFDLAKYVIEITEKRVSYYNILVKHICKRGQFKDAKDLLEEMRGLRCDPDTKTYNYLISSLCKQGRFDEAICVHQEMIGRGCSPNLVTFDTLIYFACRYDRSDQAVMFFSQMVSSGLKPHLSTHYAFIKGYFRSQQFEVAYRYVVHHASENKCSAQEIYNVLASLHLQDGDLIVAHYLLIEMLEKGLRPRHSIFLRATKCLYENGKANFADNLKALYYSQDVG